MDDIQLSEFQRLVGDWADATFPKSDGPSIVLHLEEEARELSASVRGAAAEFDTRRVTDRAIQDEAADVLLLLLHLAHKMRFDLQEAAMAKMQINASRTWETHDNGRGYWKHIDPATPHAGQEGA